MQRDDLAVEIRQADSVVVDQIQRGYAGACQRFDDVAADAADAEYRDARVFQLVHCLCAKEHFGARKSAGGHALSPIHIMAITANIFIGGIRRFPTG